MKVKVATKREHSKTGGDVTSPLKGGNRELAAKVRKIAVWRRHCNPPNLFLLSKIGLNCALCNYVQQRLSSLSICDIIFDLMVAYAKVE